MLYRNVECPHCGNVITVKDVKETQKCKWCRRLVLAKFKQIRGKRWSVEAEAVDFPTTKIKSLSDYEKEDIYGI